MTSRYRWIGAAAAVVMAIAWLSSPIAAGQAAVKVSRTPDGQPDIRGVWAKLGGGINEANPPDTPLGEGGDAFGGNAEPEGFSNVTTDRPRIAPDICVGPACARVFKPARPVGVVDPADRRLPWRPEADKLRRDFLAGMNPAVSWEYLEPNARCAPPPPWAGMPPKYSAAMQVFQRQGEVVMVFEDDHASRTIYLDGRPHIGPTIKLFMGDAIGKWEGNTLVVDTTNLNGKNQFSRAFPYYSDAMHLVERFTVVDADTLDYEIVYDDPKLFTRPIKSVGYFRRGFPDYEIREDACNEGNRTLRNIFGF